MVLKSDFDEERGRWLATASIFAVIALGRALQISDGFIHPDALFWVTAALVTALAGAVFPRPRVLARMDGLIPLIAAVGLLLNVGQLYTKSPILYGGLPVQSLAGFHLRLAVLTVAAGIALIRFKRFSPGLQAGVLVAAHFAVGVWIIQQSPAPQIDVHIFQRNAIAALWSGRNPYGLTYPNIYSDDTFYGPGLSVHGRLRFGYPYFPLSLLLAMPGQLLAGDPRYSQLVALELVAILMAFTRRNGFGLMAAALFLTTPRLFFVLEQSWTEPFVVVGLAALVFAASRQPRAAPWLFGAFVGIKQYLVLAIPCAPLLVRDRRALLRFLGKASLAAGGVMLPFILWNPKAFWKSVVALQFYQPFRVDALGYLSWWARQGHPRPTAAIAFVAALIANALALWRLPRTPAGFAFGVALTLFMFFAFNKQAFCNYYFSVIGAFAVTLAACIPREER